MGFLLVPQKNATPPNFKEKNFANGRKILKFAEVFSLKSLPQYSITLESLAG